MRRQDFYYHLPKELIAQTPLEDRSSSRLMLLDRDTGKVGHDIFKNITAYLNAGDLLVLNDTRVIPARLYGKRRDTGGAVEFLLLRKYALDTWETLVRPGKRAGLGSEFVFGDEHTSLSGKITDITDSGNRIIKFFYGGVFEDILDRLGEMPLPPYIKQKLCDKERYQTVYSKYEGSAAAPTAGLHFTQELLDKIRQKGVNIAMLTLHVGLGTFRPVKADDITEHKMHEEFYMLPPDTAEAINRTKREGGRVIAVGTTACRVLETVADKDGLVKAQSGWTGIFIYPGYRFRCIDALITNFHLPESTLIMLVSAFAGREKVLSAYQTAIKEGYRFFSFGDSMFIL